MTNPALLVPIIVTLVGLGTSDEGLHKFSGHLQPLGNHRPMEAKVDSLTKMPNPVEFYSRYVEAAKPVVLRGVLNGTFPVNEWTDDYLRVMFGDVTVSAHLHKKNHKKPPSVSVSLHEFLEKYKSEPYTALGNIPQGMQYHLELPSCLGCGGFLNNSQTIVFTMCTGNSNSFLHSESFEIMVCLVDGTQEYMLMEPKYARVIEPEWDTYRFYNIDVEAVNITAHPGLLEVPWYGATVDKGDCLYIPYEWIRYIKNSRRNLDVSLLWLPFDFSIDQCVDMNMTDTNVLPATMPARDIAFKKFLQLKALFLSNRRDDGRVYAHDVYKMIEMQGGIRRLLSIEDVIQMFGIVKPFSKGIIPISYIKNSTVSNPYFDVLFKRMVENRKYRKFLDSHFGLDTFDTDELIAMGINPHRHYSNDDDEDDDDDDDADDADDDYDSDEEDDEWMSHLMHEEL